MSARRKVWRRRFFALIRVGFVLMLAQLATLCWSFHQAEAAVGEALERLAGQLENVPDLVPGRVHTLTVNGAQFKTRSAHSELGVSQVLDAAQAWCGRRGGLVEASEIPLSAASVEPSGQLGLRSIADGALRLESDEQGVMVCFDSGGSLGIPTLLASLQEFAQTGDLAVLGSLHYLRVQSTASGTAMLAVWTEGPLRLDEMFPARGDAPGTDLEGFPRPPGARRLLSGTESESEPWLLVYETTSLTPHEARRFYAAALARTGWQRAQLGPGAGSPGDGGVCATPERTPALAPGDASWVLRRGDRTAVLRFDSGEGGRAVVSVSVL